MAEADGAGDLAVEFGFEVVDGGGAGFDFGDDLVLFGEGWERDPVCLDFAEINVGVRSSDCCNMGLLASYRTIENRKKVVGVQVR